MKTVKSILFIAITISVISCSTSFKVTSDYDKTANFGNYKTFAFVEPKAGDMHFFEEQYPKIVNQENIDRLKESIIKEMESKGYVQSANADLTVSYLIMLQTNTRLQSSPISAGTTPGYYGYYGGGWGGVGGENIVAADYRTGSMMINIVENKSDNVIWYGTASGVMSANPTKSYKNIPIRVKEVFSKYYWQAGQSEPVTPLPVQ